MSAPLPFVHLGARSEYSIGESWARIDDLCREAARHGQSSLALTEVDSLASAPAFQRAAHRAGILPVFGAELTVASHGGAPGAWRVRLLVESLTGWRQLLRLLHRGLRAGATPLLPFEALLEDTRGLLLLIGGARGELTAAMEREEFERAERIVETLRTAWPADRLFVEIPDPVGAAPLRRAKTLVQAATFFALRTVAVPTVAVAHAADDCLRRLLSAANAVPSNSLADFEVPQEERAHLAESALVARRFAAFPEAFATAGELAARCGSFTLPQAERRFPIYDFMRGVDAESFIWNVAFERATDRYGDFPTSFKERLNLEFRQIVDAGMANALISQFRLHEELENVGVLRGPGAGVFTSSLIASLLDVTRIDPLRFGLPFQLPETISSVFPPLEFSVPTAQEGAAAQALVTLFRGQVCALGKWQRVREHAALDTVAEAAGLGTRERALLKRDEDYRAAREAERERPASAPADMELSLDHPRTLAWMARRLEGRVRGMQPIAGHYVFSVDALAQSLPVHQVTTEGLAVGLVCEWTEEEIAEFRFGSAVFRNAPLLDLIGDAVLSVRSAGEPDFAPERFASDDTAAYRLLREGRTAGIEPLESPTVRRAIQWHGPDDLYSLIALHEVPELRANELDFRTLLLCHAAMALKANRPAAFYAAALSQAGAETRRLAAILEEAREARVPVQPLDINCSSWNWMPEGATLRPGFCVLTKLTEAAAEEILERRREMAFTDLADLLRRTDASILRETHAEALIASGALDGFGHSREVLQSQAGKLFPLLRPSHRPHGSGDDPLSFFGHSSSWWMETQEPISESETATAMERSREREREATAGVALAAWPLSGDEKLFRKTARVRTFLDLTLRDAGSPICLEGRLDAWEEDPEERGAVLVSFDGCYVRVRGELAKVPGMAALAGKRMLATGRLKRENPCWLLEAESLISLDRALLRARSAGVLEIDANAVDAEKAKQLSVLLRRFAGLASVRFAIAGDAPPKSLQRIAKRQVLLCPLLELELTELLGADAWRTQVGTLTAGDMPLAIAPGAASIVRRVFRAFVKPEKIEAASGWEAASRSVKGWWARLDSNQ